MSTPDSSVPERPSTRTVVRVCLAAAATFAALAICWKLRGVIELVVCALLVAVALGPPVELAARRMPRVMAIAVVYLACAGLIALVGLAVIPPVVNEIARLSQHIPTYLHDLRSDPTVTRLGLDDSLGDAQAWERRLGDVAGTLRTVTFTIGTLALRCLAVATIAFFLLLEAPKLMSASAGVMHADRHDRLRGVAGDIYRCVGGYVAGTLLVGTMAGVMTYITLTLLGVPFALPLALALGAADLVPLLGGTIGALTVGAACLTVSVQAAITWAVVFVIYQQIENGVLQPLIYRRTVRVHPLIVIVGVLAGATLGGVLGALLAIPLAAVAQILLRDWWAHRAEPITLPAVGLVHPPSSAADQDDAVSPQPGPTFQP